MISPSVLISTHEPLVLFSLPCPGAEGSDRAALVGGCLSSHYIVLRAKLCTSTNFIVQPNFTASLRAQCLLVMGSCSVPEIVQDDIECTSVMEIAHLNPMIHVTCQNPDPDLFAVTDFLTTVDL